MGMMNRERYAEWKPGDKVKYATACMEPTLAKQEFAKESDINYIMKRYNATGQLPVDFKAIQPVFADVSNIGDFGDCLRRVTAAEEAFNELPADVRTRFQNDPVQLVTFLQDPNNRKEAEELKLIPASEPVVAPTVQPAVPEKTV